MRDELRALLACGEKAVAILMALHTRLWENLENLACLTSEVRPTEQLVLVTKIVSSCFLFLLSTDESNTDQYHNPNLF